jgi:hypothetical protein
MTRRLGVGTSGGASSVSVHSEAWFIRAQRAAGGNTGGEIVEQRTPVFFPARSCGRRAGPATCR